MGFKWSIKFKTDRNNQGPELLPSAIWSPPHSRYPAIRCLSDGLYHHITFPAFSGALTPTGTIEMMMEDVDHSHTIGHHHDSMAPPSYDTVVSWRTGARVDSAASLTEY